MGPFVLPLIIKEGPISLLYPFIPLTALFMYSFLLESWRGQTFGKWLMKVVVVKEDGSECDPRSILYRNLYRFIDYLPMYFLLGFFSIIVNRKAQRIGDRYSGSLVVAVEGTIAPEVLAEAQKLRVEKRRLKGVPGTERLIMLRRLNAAIFDLVIIFIFLVISGVLFNYLFKDRTLLDFFNTAMIFVILGTLWLPRIIEAGFELRMLLDLFPLCIFLAIWALYSTIMEWHWGQTIGKKLMRVIVVKKDGGDCDLKTAFLRNIFRLIDYIPGHYLLGFFVILFSKRKQRIGDYLAGTTVQAVEGSIIIEEEKRGGRD